MTELSKIHLGGSTFDSRLRERGFITQLGWNDELAGELVTQSKDPVIMESTPRDHTERFTSVASAYEWYQSSDRTVYSLYSHDGLAGVFWISPQVYETAEKTIAIRLYESARGKGLAPLFGKTALYHHERWQGYTGDTWLETGAANLAGQHTFTRLGFEAQHNPTMSPDRLRMVRLGITARSRAEEDQVQQ